MSDLTPLEHLDYVERALYAIKNETPYTFEDGSSDEEEAHPDYVAAEAWPHLLAVKAALTGTDGSDG